MVLNGNGNIMVGWKYKGIVTEVQIISQARKMGYMSFVMLAKKARRVAFHNIIDPTPGVGLVQYYVMLFRAVYVT